MASPSDRSATLRLSAKQLEHSELLVGLEAWQHLGLLSDRQIAAFCQEYLTCLLPVPLQVESQTGIASEPPISESVVAQPVIRQPSFVSRSLQSLMAEVSVIWLLFLGVFLVVVSSGVLAATQWQNFSPVGQYSILFAYTLTFAAASLWTSRQPSLRLTTRMLKIATLLIIPINFWMMDGLQIATSWAGLGFAAIASLTLTLITLRFLRPHVRTVPRLWLAANSVGLSWLHWGWHWEAMPIIATYVGTIGTALILFTEQQATNSAREASENLGREASDSGDRPGTPETASLLIILSTLLLIGRAVLAAQVPIDRLGLALGVSGWLLCRLARSEQSLWRWSGVGLLVMGWLVAIPASLPWQAIAVSGLGLWLLIDRLRFHRERATLLTVFLVGLQTYAALWRLIPLEERQRSIEFVTQLAGDRGMPEALIGLGGFPYLVLVLAVAAWVRQTEQDSSVVESAEHTSSDLAQNASDSAQETNDRAKQAEILALISGVILTLIGWENPLVRSLNLTLSSVALAAVARSRRLPLGLLYLTHITGLTAVLSWINLLFPGLDPLAWAKVLLGGMAIEWGLSVGTAYLRWRRSAWHLGLVLAALADLLLLSRILTPGTAYGNLIGLLIPAGLMLLSRSPFPHQRLAAWLSALMLVVQLPLLNSLNAWLISLGIAIALMLVNTRKLRHLLAAVLTLAFGLGFEAVAIAQQTAIPITAGFWVSTLATTLWALWLLRGWLLRSSTPLRQLYAQAANIWAIALCALTLLVLTGFYLGGLTGSMILATSLTIGAIAFRLWQQPTSLGFYGMAWGLQLLVAAVVNLRGGSFAELAIATLGLGLAAQLAGDVWVKRSGRYWRCWHVIPLLYAGMGGALGHFSWTATTGLYTLAAGLIGIGVGRRWQRTAQPALKPIALLSVLLLSVAAYELLLYPLSQAKGGNPGDGVVLLAGLAALMAGAYRFCTRWLVPYFCLTVAELQSIAHLHWAMGSSLALVAIALGLSDSGSVWGIAVAVVLSGYALVLGRGTASQAERWTYAGIFEAIALLSYGFYRLAPETLWSWVGAIAAAGAVGLYSLPWGRWGWPIRPWRNTAVGLPALVVLLTSGAVGLQSLLIVAAFYAWLATSMQRLRLSYVSLLLLDWAILRHLSAQGWLNSLGLGLVIGASLLYVAQLDPALQNASAREQRHWLRSIATALICLTALYQAEIERSAAFGIGLLTLGIGLGLVFLGLLTQVRAFLYVGTAMFVMRILRLLWLFVGTYPTLLWAVGIALGLLLIWIAATFEARRTQVNSLMQYWMTELESWD